MPSFTSASPTSRQIEDSVDAELVRGLYSALLPMVVMGLFSGSIGLFLTARDSDPWLGAFGAAVALLTVARVVLVLRVRPLLAAPSPSREMIRRAERAYAAGSFAFSILIGLLGARGFASPDPVAHLLVTGLVYGYGCGVVSRLSVRPWVAVPSLALGVLPPALSAVIQGEPAFLAHGLVMAGFAVASLETVRHLHGTTRGEMRARRELAGLARHDNLTGLPNRLAMRERLSALLSRVAPGSAVAVLFVDLDRFKDVNDQLGHPVGDKLLKAVAERLLPLLSPGDLVARIGGDEFVLATGGVAHAETAEILARRVVRALRQPFAIDGREVRIGGSVGLALCDRPSESVDDAIARADEALYAVKQRGRNGFMLARPDERQMLKAATG